MRGFLIGLVLLAGLSMTILSLRPGGIRRQLRFAARRFRIMLVLGGIFVLGSSIIRVAYAQGAIADYGPAALAMTLAAVFLVVGRDPATPDPGSSKTPTTLDDYRAVRSQLSKAPGPTDRPGGPTSQDRLPKM